LLGYQQAQQDDEVSARVSAKVTVELDVAGQMRDGVTLRATVYRPDGSGPWPTLLTRTPYGKDLAETSTQFNPVQAARQGFMVVVQDTRGRFASEGDWTPFRHERHDGYDSVEWTARLPGSNGRVGMFGESYVGSTQWSAAIEQPPSLAAIAPALTWSDPADGLYSRGGAIEIGSGIPWALLTNIDYVGRLPLEAADRDRQVTSIIDDYDRLQEAGYWDVPASDPAVLKRRSLVDLSFLRGISDVDASSWSRVNGCHSRVNVPSFHIGGWYDIFLQGTLDNFSAMRELGRDARLVVGPWSHGMFSDPIGSRVFGLRANRSGVPNHHGRDLVGLQLAWFRRWLDPGSPVTLSSAPVRIFVMGRNTWRDEDSWPPARAIRQLHFLHADGSLKPSKPDAGEGPSEFVYDPSNPVLTHGGALLTAPAFPAGQYDQASVEARRDVLAFTSDPLPEDLEVTGRVRVALHVKSSAPATDWVARLCDVDTNGQSWNVCDGIVRELKQADAPGRREVDLWSTSYVFLKGHRLRLQVTSSCFPRWDRNLNTGDQSKNHFAIAHQHIYHDADRASYLDLPVID
jgi:putative CocE/NonD family hydrolase